jgi:hypothetical protein
VHTSVYKWFCRKKNRGLVKREKTICLSSILYKPHTFRSVFRIRIQIRVFMTKNSDMFFTKNAIFLFLVFYEGLSSYIRSLQPSKENIQYFQFCKGNFCLPRDPDPQSQTLNPDPDTKRCIPHGHAVIVTWSQVMAYLLTPSTPWLLWLPYLPFRSTPIIDSSPPVHLVRPPHS